MGARRQRKAAAAVGRRERNKRDKTQRIRAAARELFARQGYGATTMRQIAARAQVALGTLFNYADDKRDLVFLIFNSELDALANRALAASRSDQPFVDQLLALFGSHYRRFARSPVLSRVLLQELTFYSEGKQAAAFQAIRQRLIDGITEIVRTAQAEGHIRDDEDAAFVGRHIFFVYSAAIRWWIARQRPKVKDGVAELRRLIELQINGLAAAPGLTRAARPVRHDSTASLGA